MCYVVIVVVVFLLLAGGFSSIKTEIIFLSIVVDCCYINESN